MVSSNKKTARKYHSTKTNNNQKSRTTREQPAKDSSSKRVNLDNVREKKFIKKFNDISWYSRNPELLKAAASLPFASISGNPLAWSRGNQYLPGIMQISYVPTIGGTFGEAEPFAINQAKDSMYSFVVHANSRNYNGESSDYMIVTLAGAQAFAFMAHLIRAYGIAKTYMEQNRFQPDALLTAMGFYPDDFRKNLSNVWFNINELISRTTQFWIPNVMPILQRWFWLNSNVYKDSMNPRAQYYVFVPKLFWVYSETLATTGGGLAPMMEQTGSKTSIFDPSTKQYTWQQWMDQADIMFSKLIASEDRGIIYGDILKAFGAEKIWALPPIDASYRIEPVYEPEVLTQIENLTTVSPLSGQTHFGASGIPLGVCQVNNNLYPVFYKNTTAATLTQGLALDRLILNFHDKDQPTPEDIMIATRLSSLGTSFSQVYVATLQPNDMGKPELGNHLVTTTCGSEMVTGLTLFSRNGSATLDRDQLYLPTSVATDSQNYARKMELFDWHPFIYVMQEYTTPTSASFVPTSVATAAYGDYDNYTMVGVETLSKMHSTALFSEFGVPFI